jgi:RNA polymerase sigma-70 factor (ECF subfamily)
MSQGMKFEDKRLNLRELVVTAKECTEARELFFRASLKFAQDFLRKRYRSIQEATREDIAQNGMAKALSRIDQLKDSQRVHGWLGRILLNQVSDWYKRERPKHMRLGIPLSSLSRREGKDYDPSDGGKENPLKALLIRCEHEDYTTAFNRLPELHKEVLGLRYGQDLSYEEIADRLNIRVGTVRSRVHKAREHLKKIVKELSAYQDTAHNRGRAA